MDRKDTVWDPLRRKEVALTPEEPFIDTWGAYPAKGAYNLAIVVQLYTGERPTIYTGKVKF